MGSLFFMKKRRIIFLSIAVLIFVIFSNIFFEKLLNLPDEFYVNYQEIENANKEDLFGKIIDLSLQEKDISTGEEKKSESIVIFKLFGVIPIKKVKVNILPEDEVYIGGMPIGLSLQTDGALVVSDTTIDPSSEIKVNKNKYFKNGDIIKEINGVKINSLDDISIILQENGNETVEIVYQRNNQDKTAQVQLLKDSEGKYKMGIWVRDDISGIGTLTFVQKDNKFAALGHAVTTGQNENIIPLTRGEIYDASLVNIQKGQKNSPGELRCVFVQKNKQGEISKNTKVGLYGELDNIENLIDTNKTALLGGRLSVKPGKAKIVSCVSGIQEEYDIEIIKANYQSKSDDKSMVIRVTDKRLLELTGGIVQGMSGSPIIQNGKVVGAVTHVFISDPTKGYGVYSDWMLEQLNQ